VNPSAVLLHAAVFTAEASDGVGRALFVRSIASGPAAAIVGPVRREGATRAALRHARIVADALEGCSSVVPFRAGLELPSEQDVLALFTENRDELLRCLRAVSGRVEMGLKVRIPSSPGVDAVRLDVALERIRSLASMPIKPLELRRPAADGHVLEACYLLPRDRIEPFWVQVDALRIETGLRVLGTGPWAPYSFCDLALRPASPAAPGVLLSDRSPS